MMMGLGAGSDEMTNVLVFWPVAVLLMNVALLAWVIWKLPSWTRLAASTKVAPPVQVREVRISDAEVARGNSALPDYGWYLLAHGVRRSEVRSSFYDSKTSEMVFIVAA